MNLKEPIRIFVLALGGALAIKLYGYFGAKGMDDGLSLVTAVVITTSIVKLMQYLLLEAPMRVRSLRSMLDPSSALEGVWINEIEALDPRPVSIACIEYNAHSGSYRYFGYGFDVEGAVRATWESTRASIDLSRDRLDYLGEGQLKDGDAEVIKSFGELLFKRDEGGVYRSGTGFFVDFGTGFFKTTFSMQRLVDLEGRPLRAIPSVEDCRDLVLTTVEARGEKA